MKGLNSVSRFADSPGMPRHFPPRLLLRLVVLTLVWVFATTSITLASDDSTATEPLSTAPPPTQDPLEEATVLVVPDVRRQTYVFAKGFLEDAGFPWQAAGTIKVTRSNRVSMAESRAPLLRREHGRPRDVSQAFFFWGTPNEGFPRTTRPTAAPSSSSSRVFRRRRLRSAGSQQSKARRRPLAPPLPRPSLLRPSPSGLRRRARSPPRPQTTRPRRLRPSLDIEAQVGQRAGCSRQADGQARASAPRIRRCRRAGRAGDRDAAAAAGRRISPTRWRPPRARQQSLMRYFRVPHNWVVYGHRFRLAGRRSGAEDPGRARPVTRESLERRARQDQSARAALAFVASRKAR